MVAALDHPYDSATVVLTDGRTINTKLALTYDPVQATRVRAADLSFVPTPLGRLNRGEIAGPLSGRLETGRVAVTGHSVSGAALHAARQDRRFDAAIDLDGYPHDPTPRSFHQPVLALTQAITPETDPRRVRRRAHGTILPRRPSTPCP
ncbi:hypothetical protein QFZ82_007541 [Streptomyces sp. V4I23]|nr:hypothetical protein [Streptomyces sp. V4I23]